MREGKGREKGSERVRRREGREVEDERINIRDNMKLMG